jgi:hypothetical protein
MRRNRNLRVVGGLLALLAPPPAAFAIDLFVNSTLDQIDDDVTDGICHTAAGTCTLRAAVMTANRFTGNVRVDIFLPAGEFHLTRPPIGGNGDDGGDLNFTDAATGDPLLVLRGAGPALTTIDADSSDRVVRVHAGARVEIGDVTLREGFAGVTEGGGCLNNAGALGMGNVIVDTCVAGNGGGLKSSGAGASLELYNVSFRSNTASTDGGGLWVTGAGYFSACDFSFNQAGRGGAIFAPAGADARFFYSNLSLNSAPGGEGGGVFVSGSLRLIRSLVWANGADSGGGASVGATGELLLDETTVSENAAGTTGGGVQVAGFLQTERSTIYANSAQTGGGIDLASGAELTMIESTVSTNGAFLSGGGLNLHPSSLMNAYSSTVAFNAADADQNGSGFGAGLQVESLATVNLRNCLVAGNYHETQFSPNDCAGTVSSYGRNLFGTVGGCTIQTGTGSWTLLDDLAGIAPIGPNGGRTWTHALLPGTNAIDGGDPALGCQGPLGLLTVDQRGAARALGARCDVGAYEAGTLFFDGFESGGVEAWTP